ncbi:hypothetical protein KJ980_07735, partial [Patescibacteria group bacterium]|nr:hypothetical protein [Patescibacteria group bacterium]
METENTSVPISELSTKKIIIKEQKPIIRDIANYKKDIELKISSKTQTVEGIFKSLENHTPLGAEEKEPKKVLDNPQEILDKMKNNLSKLSEIKNPTIDDIAKNLISPGLDAQGMQIWLETNKKQIQSLTSNKNILEEKNTELLAQLAKEKQKNIVAKLYSLKKRLKLTSQIKESQGETVNLNQSIGEAKLRLQQIEPVFNTLNEQRQEFAIKATEQLFPIVIEEQRQLKDRLISPEVKNELNNDLIAEKVLPKLKEVIANGKITHEEAKEYMDLLKIRLSKGNNTNRNGISKEEKKTIEATEHRLNYLDFKSNNTLPDISLRIDDITTADAYYDKIFDTLLRQATKEKIEQLRDTFRASLDGENKEHFARIAEDIIDDPPKWEGKYSEKSLDLNKVDIGYFKDLDGLERWAVVKKFAKSTDVIPKEIFDHTEKIIIQRLFDEQLFPGGYESDAGNSATRKMGHLDNTYALPLMLRHIETYGAGHTSVAVLNQMQHLIKNGSPDSLKNLPENERLILKIIGDENSYLGRFEKDKYNVCNYVKKLGDRILRHEKYTKTLESAGISEEELKSFYHMSNEGDITQLLGQINKVAEITDVDKKTIIEDYFDDLTSKIYFTKKETPNTIKQLSQELEVPAKDIYDRIKDNFSVERVSNYPEALWNPVDSIEMLKGIASLIDVDKKELIEQYFDQLTSNISLQKKHSANIIKQLSLELDRPAKEIYEKVQNKFKSEKQGYGYNPLQSLEIIKEIATITGIDKTELIEQYFSQLTSTLYIEQKNSADIIKQLSVELNQPGEKIYERVKDKFNSSSLNPLESLEILKEIAAVINADKKDFIRQHLSQLTDNINYKRPGAVDIIEKISGDIANPPEKTVEE